MESGSRNQAKQWIEKAKNFYRSFGKNLALVEFSASDGMFVKSDLYIFVLDSLGTMLAHGNNKKLIGENIMEAKDSEGRCFIREIVESATLNGHGSVDYTWYHPMTKDWSPRSAYFEVVDDLIFCATVY
jgi:signal transduction histidine kinase